MNIGRVLHPVYIMMHSAASMEHASKTLRNGMILCMRQFGRNMKSQS